MSLTALDLVAEARPQITEVDPPAAHGTLGADVVIDVREPAEYDAGHLPGAINLPRGVLEFRLADLPELAPRTTPILLYCKTGGRAALAALNLQRMGYTRVRSIAGGYDSWRQQGLPVDEPATRE